MAKPMQIILILLVLLHPVMSSHPHFSHISVLNDKFILDDGIEMEVKYAIPSKQFKDCHNRPALIFLHGSFHSAWCWDNFMPYFASLGHPCVALSLRGTSKTPYISHGEDKENKVKIDEHVKDVLCFLRYVNKHMNKEKCDCKNESKMRLFVEYIQKCQKHGYMAPIIIAHSFGGLTCMKLLEQLQKDHTKNQTPLLSSIALLCSVPPSGIAKMSLRAMMRNPVKGWRIMKGLAMKKATTDPKLCRLLFFDEDCPEERLQKYLSHFEEDSKVTIDVQDMAKKLPILKSDSYGRSTCFGVLQYPALVLGGTKDYIVDQDAVEETSNFLSTCHTFNGDQRKCNHVLVKDAVHDVMLGACWRDVAKEIELWLNSIVGMAESARLSQ